MDINSFEESFEGDHSSMMKECACRTVFYNYQSEGVDWEEGELEALESNQNTIGLDHYIGVVSFEGKEYVMHCGCWHERARRVMQFIDSHSHSIARYINAEKKRKLAEAEAMPEIDRED